MRLSYPLLLGGGMATLAVTMAVSLVSIPTTGSAVRTRSRGIHGSFAQQGHKQLRTVSENVKANGFFDGVMESLGLSSKPRPVSPMEFYNLKTTTLEGEPFSFDSLKGKAVLITNVASKWGATDSNYKQLVELYKKYKDQGLEIVAFPSNQFGSQEPGSPSEIRAFVKNYGVEFPMMSKIDVNGPSTSPVYKFLKGEKGGDIIWNFATKFLVTKDGKMLTRFDGMKAPESLEDDIVAVLNA